MADKDKQFVRPASAPLSSPDTPQPGRGHSSRSGSGGPAEGPGRQDGDELYDLLPELRPPKLSPEAIEAAMQAMQIEPEITNDDSGVAAGISCRVCGHKNRIGNKFCARCGGPMESKDADFRTASGSASPIVKPLSRDAIASASAIEPADTANGTHHYHHHYHHHFFPGADESAASRPPGNASREPERLRAAPGSKGEQMSRVEVAVRRVTQDWVVACNTKHLDDLVDFYVADALVMRSNFPAVRGAAAIREFFFNALDGGLGDVEVEPLRVEVVGGIAYEAGRCKALVPGASGKRREERGKYLWVLAKQSDGDWKLVADCWASDLTLPTPDEAALTAAAKSPMPRKNL